MIILGVECTASPVSCALLDDGKIKAEYFLNQKTTHSQTLMPMVKSVLELSGLSINDIDAFAVTAGPGSFTGVRIGVSAVKGLAAPGNIPCVPVSVLESMAYNIITQNGIVCSVMNARCGQVYNALFKIENGAVGRLCADRALDMNELYGDIERVLNGDTSKPVFIVGDGAELFYDSTAGRGLNMTLAPENFRWQRASSVCLAAWDRAAAGDAVGPDELLPFYLRLPQAERELKLRNIKKDEENG